MTDLMGYADALAVDPGGRIGFKVSCDAVRYTARIVRLLSPEVDPRVLSFRTEPVGPAQDLPGRVQALLPGSAVIVPAHPTTAALRSFTVQAMVWTTLPGDGRQALIGTWSETARTGFGLLLDEAGRLELRIGRAVLRSARKLLPRRWYLVAGSFDAETGSTALHLLPLPNHTMAAADPDSVAGTAPGSSADRNLVMAAWHEADADGLDGARPRLGGHYNGKLDRPRLARTALPLADIIALAHDAAPTDPRLVGSWDFSRDIPTDRIVDVTPNRLDGTTVNTPARAMTGFNWDGSEADWRHAPGQYGAIHFHDDDMTDVRWHTDFHFDAPADLRSGCYAAVLEAAEARFHIVFYVRPPASTEAKVVYLASTATHTVYTNNIARFTGTPELYQGRVTVLDAVDTLLLKHPGMGYSTYDRHRDGSGVAYSSRLRPATNIRPTGRIWNFCVDMMIIDWLDRSGIPFDIVTEEDLHLRGLDAIRPYRVLLTGSHPEYDSLEMLDGLDAWLRQGGRLMYMGGNGFYWRIAHHPENPAIIEVRRAEGGTRAWDTEPGESRHSFTGEYGGLWRRNGRAPQALAGVGFISQGFDRCQPYRRRPEADDPRAAFIFEGVTGEIIGEYGLMMGGAAGMEIDCVDERLGTPPHALVLARSFDHSNTYELVLEEILVANGLSDALLNESIHADLTFYETPYGGAVFSTGSIAYAGALSHNGYDNAVARLTGNVLRRFADPAPFAMP